MQDIFVTGASRRRRARGSGPFPCAGRDAPGRRATGGRLCCGGPIGCTPLFNGFLPCIAARPGASRRPFARELSVVKWRLPSEKLRCDIMELNYSGTKHRFIPRANRVLLYVPRPTSGRWRHELSEKSQDTKDLAARAIESDAVLAELVENLSGASRRIRQISAAVLAQVAKESPDRLIDYAGAVVDALNRPEAQTRWECLDVLTALVDRDSRVCDRAVSGAETALFDEESGPVRLAAMRFLCALGATTENRSEKVWPLVDEAIQCYHGDLEFQDMLVAVVDFSAGKLSPTVKSELAERMKFDAENSRGALKRRAAQIIENVS